MIRGEERVEPVMIKQTRTFLFVLAVAGLLSIAQFTVGQGDGSRRSRGAPKPVTVPVTIRVKKPIAEVRVVDFLIREDGEVQSQLSIRRPAENPITLALLLQDDLVSSISTETKNVGF